MKTYIEDITYKNVKSIKFSNNIIEAIIPKEFGPRILYLGFVKHKKNIFSEPTDVQFKNKYGVWKIYGGHRLWIAPENLNTYYPDNEEVEIKYSENLVIVKKNFYPIGIGKEISLSFLKKNKLQVKHRIYNLLKHPQKISLWTLSVMCKNGVAILPQNKNKSDEFGFLPNRNLVLWKYTDFKDPRFKIDNDFIFIRQTPKIKKAFKIGQYLTSGYIAYQTKEFIFKKIFKPPEPYPQVLYPDFQSNIEIYCCDKFLELELLTPLLEIKKGNFIQHTELWELNEK